MPAKLEDCLSDIREDVGLAWQEQSRASQEDYDRAESCSPWTICESLPPASRA